MKRYRDKKIGFKIIITLVISMLFLLPGPIITAWSNDIELENNTMVTYNYESDHEISISFEIQDYLLQDQVMTEQGVFTTFKIPNAGFIGNLGRPQLPVVTQIIAVPTLDVSLNIIDAQIAETSWVDKVYPAQMPHTDNENIENTEFIIDESFYQQNINYPSTITELIYDGKIRDICFVKIEFYPVQYNPKQGIATIYDEITISLSWDDSEIVNVESGFDHTSFSSFYENVFPNWQDFLEHTSIVESPPQNPGNGIRDTGCDYLIITHPDFYSEIIELADWKHSKGLMTKVVDTTTTGTTSSAIQQYIQDAYDTWDPRPSYILLVGDEEFVPTNYEYSAASDLWYTSVDGSDYSPEIFIGRIPADTSQETNIIVQKILNYEQTPPASSDFYENFVVAGYFQDDENNGYETRRFVRTSEEVRDYLLSEGYDGERIYCTESNRNPTHYNNGYYGNGEPLPNELLRPTFAWDGDKNDLINAIESGIFILNHRDHGAEWGWGDPHFSIDDFSSFSNGELLPVVFSINCLTGRFDGGESFCEEFLRKDDGGAVAAFGASRVSYSGYNDYLCRGFYDSLWPDFDIDVGEDTPMYSLGEILNYGKTYMGNTWGDPWGYERLTFELFHVFGDPSMEIWTAFPQDLDVSYETLENEFKVTVKDSGGSPVVNALVCLSQESGLFEKGLTDSTGKITLDTTSGNYDDEATLVVTKHDHLRYLETFFLNQKPNIPNKPEGPVAGQIRTEYTFHTSSTDPEEDQLYYKWRWGDGYYSDWLGPNDSGESASATHKWTKSGNYKVRVKTMDTNGAETDWSDPLNIGISKIKANNLPFLQLFERFPNAFPILRQILGL
jgi:hypothetical protein